MEAPSLYIGPECEEYNQKLLAEKKQPCRACIDACPYAGEEIPLPPALKVSRIFRDPITGEMRVCGHCPPETAGCLKECRNRGNEAMDLKDNIIVVDLPQKAKICKDCPEVPGPGGGKVKPCFLGCPFSAIRKVTVKGTDIPVKCDLCMLANEILNTPGAPPRCVLACPVNAIKYKKPRELLWLRRAGVEIIPDPPKGAELVEERLNKMVSIYRVPGDAYYHYWYKIPSARTLLNKSWGEKWGEHLGLKEIENYLIDVIDAAITRLIETLYTKIINGEIIEPTHLTHERYITHYEYVKVEETIKKAVITLMRSKERDAPIKCFYYRGKNLVIIPEICETVEAPAKEEALTKDEKARTEELAKKPKVRPGDIILNIYYKPEKGEKIGPLKVVLDLTMQRTIADIAESLTHGPSFLKRLLQDPDLEDIEMNGIYVPGRTSNIFVYDKNYGHMITNIIPKSQEKMVELVNKLVQYTGQGIKLDPFHQIIDARLPGGERLNIKGPNATENGPTFTIRKKVLKDMSPVVFCTARKVGDRIVPPMISVEGMVMLWHLIESGLHVVFGGATASGKTSLLNACLQFIPPMDRIIVVQDTPELEPWQPNTESLVIASLEGKTREEAMNERIMAALRSRPSYLIYGELRGSEARSYFSEGIYSGGAAKGTAATIHFDTIEDIVERVRFKPMEVPASNLLKLDLLVECTRIEDPNTRELVRKVTRFGEPGKKLLPGEKLDVITTWKINEEGDFLPIRNVKSALLESSRQKKGMTKQEYLEDYRRKCYVLYYLVKNNVEKGKDFVLNWMARYYAPPSRSGKNERDLLVQEAEKSIDAKTKKRIDKVVEILATQF